MVTLIAMSQGGDVYLTRDDHGVVHRHHRYLPGDPIQVNSAEAELVIDAQAYIRYNESFTTWTQVSDFVEARVPKVSAADLPISARLARALLPELREATSDPLRAALVPSAIGRLLTNDAVLNDSDLRHDLLHILMRNSVTSGSRIDSNLGRMELVRSYYDTAIAA